MFSLYPLIGQYISGTTASGIFEARLGKEEMGKENEMIHFKEIPSTKVLSVYHKGSYQRLTEAYRFILDYLKENHLEYSDLFREIYIDGRWNKENEEDYLTEIQVPLK